MSCNHIHSYTHSANIYWGTFLVVQWLRILLPVQGTRVWCLVWEDSTWCGATKAHVPQLLKPACSRARALQQESSPLSPQLEKTHAQQWRPSAAKKKCSYWVTTMCSGICPYVCFRLLGSRRHIWSDITPMNALQMTLLYENKILPCKSFSVGWIGTQIPESILWDNVQVFWNAHAVCTLVLPCFFT